MWLCFVLCVLFRCSCKGASVCGDQGQCPVALHRPRAPGHSSRIFSSSALCLMAACCSACSVVRVGHGQPGLLACSAMHGAIWVCARVRCLPIAPECRKGRYSGPKQVLCQQHQVHHVLSVVPSLACMADCCHCSVVRLPVATGESRGWSVSRLYKGGSLHSR